MSLQGRVSDFDTPPTMAGRCYLYTFTKAGLSYAKDNANERNENLFSNCRVQIILCKDNANERNENLFSNCRVQIILCKDNANRAK